MAIHVVCLDGTNQVKVQAHPTNIARIFDTLGGVAVDADNGSFETATAGPPALTGKYLPGVGSQGDPVLKLLGNAFGDGIAEPILRGYTFLSRNYVAGDRIVLTGFSRGATAARALAGLCVAHGLLDSTRYDPNDKTSAYLRAIAAWYAYREPNGGFADQARLALIGGTLQRSVPKLTAADYTPPPVVQAVGVFDTVSSLGLPQITPNGGAAFDFSICDTALSPDIQNGFHALAADETRDLFSPTFWATRAGVVQQVFPGCHSDVGGGFPNRGLSDGALDWMLTQFQTVGLVCDRTRLNPPLTPNPLDLAQDDGATFPFVLTPRSGRAFPDSAAASASLIRRWGNLTEMLPSLAPKPYKPAGAYADGRPLH
jgi:uncharacterized protein (DUF2235 family)